MSGVRLLLFNVALQTPRCSISRDGKEHRFMGSCSFRLLMIMVQIGSSYNVLQKIRFVFGSSSVNVGFGLGSIRFLAKPWYWFGSFLLTSSSFPSLNVSAKYYGCDFSTT